MARTVPSRQEAAAARFNQKVVVRLVNPVQQALGHSNSRNSRVVQTLEYFSLMRNTCPHNFLLSSVAIEKAARQLFKSNEGCQAAHYLPGQIRLENEFPWAFLVHRPTALRLECLFADVENLPADFNKADSAAEDKGLREAFRRAAEVVIRETTPKKPNLASRELIRRAYDDIWVPQALTAFADAAMQKELRADIPDLIYDEYRNIVNWEERQQAMDNFSFDEQKRILQHYAETMRESPPDLRDDKMAAIEKDFKP